MKIPLLLSVVATIFATGESLECYNCVESSEGSTNGLQQCNTPFETKENARCTASSYCMKGISSINGMTITVRQCLPGTQFDKNIPMPTDPIEMNLGPLRVTSHLCDKDLCNGASSVVMATSVAILFTSMFLFV